MTDTWDFRGAAKRLDDLDLPRIGATIGVGEDEIHAFIEVESKGSGFDGLGRPTILYEPHVAYRCSTGAKRAALVKAGLAYPKWRPGAYGPSSAQYPKLLKAMAVDQTAALKACSWGLFQVLGENHAAAGYDTVQEMVQAMMEDEENHLQACVNFLVSNGLDDDLRAHRWATLARGYNGAGYAANRYDTKLAAAFKKWQRIPDTPYPGATKGGARFGLFDTPTEPPAIEPAGDDAPENDLKPYEVEALQIRLRELGYFTVGGANKDYGGATRGAVIAFQTDHGLEANGHYTAETRAALADDDNRRPIAESRKNTTAKDLLDRGSRTVAATQEIKKTSLITYAGGAVTAGVGAVTKYAGDASSYLGQAKEMFADLPWFWLGPLLLVAIVAYLHWQGSKAEAARVDDERRFKNTADPSPRLVNQVLGQGDAS